MKTFVKIVSLLAVFFAAVCVSFGQENVVIGKRLEPLSPPKTFKLQKIEVVDDSVVYEIGFKNNSTSARFYTDGAGKLVCIYAVVDDHPADRIRLIPNGVGGESW